MNKTHRRFNVHTHIIAQIANTPLHFIQRKVSATCSYDLQFIDSIFGFSYVRSQSLRLLNFCIVKMRQAMIIPMHSNMILKLSSSSSKNKKWYSSLFHFFLELKKFQIKSGISSAGRLMSLPKLPNSRKMRVHDNSAGTNIIPFTSTVKYKSRLSYFLLCVVLSGKRDRASERSKDK